MLIKQRFPNYIDHDASSLPIKSVTTLEEFYALPFIQKTIGYEDFDRIEYAPAARGDDTELMMVTKKDGTFWVRAYIREGSLAELGFAQWVEPVRG